MGFLNTLKKSESTVEMPKVDLVKHQENLDKVLVNLTKVNPTKVDLTKHQARVAVVMDYSGSMLTMFHNGSVQRVINRLLPLALKFDDDGELETWLFSEEFKQLPPVTKHTYKNYVDKIARQSGMLMRGTKYAPVLRDVVDYYTKEQKSIIPAFIIYITDGENDDKRETDRIVRELSKYNLFIQFVGIGTNSNFSYLRKLDDLSGRECDNTGFISVEDINGLTDTELYTKLLEQYFEWLSVSKL